MRKVTKRENTDCILDSSHKLAIPITLNKALLYIANFFTFIYPMELKFELNTTVTVKCISAVACTLGFMKVSIALENAQLAIANALVLLAIIFVFFVHRLTPKN
jgi:hypothetical protein